MRTLVVVFLLSLAQPCTPTITSDLSAFNGTRCYAKDDEFYSAESCGSYDSDTCTNYCDKSVACSALCGSMCEEEAGALCAFAVLSDITSVCLNYTSTSRLRRLGDSSEIHGLEQLSDTNTTKNATQAGCDDHAYCEYCLGDEMCVHIILDVAKRVFTTELYDNLIYTGAAPMAMVLIGSLTEVCDILASDAGLPTVQLNDIQTGKEISKLNAGSQWSLPPASLLFGGLILMTLTLFGVITNRMGRKLSREHETLLAVKETAS